MNWIRRCQECGHKHEHCKPPHEYKRGSESWKDHKCKRCRSIGLDYGYDADAVQDDYE